MSYVIVTRLQESRGEGKRSGDQTIEMGKALGLNRGEEHWGGGNGEKKGKKCGSEGG